MIGLVLAVALQAGFIGPPPPSGPQYLTTAVADHTADHLAWIGVTLSADLLSTSWGLHRCPTCYEGGFGPDAEARIALKMGTAAGIGWSCYKLERWGHRNWALAMRWIYVGGTWVLVANNVTHAIRGR
jgi:hypothetical protein